MSLKRDFIHRSNDFDISPFRAVTGIILGMAYAFSLYGLFIVVREAFRLFSLTPWHELVVLSDPEVRFYNLFFAFISVIFGQSICFIIWTDRPTRAFKPGIRFKTRIVNDQRDLMWYFLYWFTSLSMIYGMFFYYVVDDHKGIFSFYPRYKYVFVLIIVVLFLHSWKSIRVSFKKRSKIWMPVSAVIISVISVALSYINLVDYKAINNALLEKNIYLKYSLNIPTLSNARECYPFRYLYGSKRNLINDIYLVPPAETENSSFTPLVFVDGNHIALDNLNRYLDSLYANRKSISVYIYTKRIPDDILLHIDKDIPMKYVNELLLAIKSLHTHRVYFRGKMDDPEYDRPYYNSILSPYQTSQHITTSREFNSHLNSLHQIGNIIGINQLEDGDYLVDGKFTPFDNLRQILLKRIINDNDYAVVLFANDAATYNSFYHVIGSLQSIIGELRDNYSYALFGQPYYYWTPDTVDTTYPIRFLCVAENVNTLQDH